LPKIKGGIQLFEKVFQAFTPLIDLAQAAAYPLLMFMFIASGCTYMTGNEISAKKMAKCAVIGYVMVQFAPNLARIIHEAGKGMAAIK
jgi:hypothetical protein